MFNVGGSELLVIFLVALIFLGPEKLPKAAKQAGNFMAQVRRMSDGFRAELKSAMDDVIETDARTEGAKLSTAEQAEPELHEVKAVAEPEIHPVEELRVVKDGEPDGNAGQAHHGDQGDQGSGPGVAAAG